MSGQDNRGGRRRRRRAIGIRDIAEQAGVSVATVSRTFNAPQTVSAELRERVLGVAKVAGYIPNAAARELASTRTWRVGAVIPTIANNIFAEFIEALAQRLAEHRYALLISTHEFDLDREARAIEGMLAAGVEAVLLSGLSHDPDILLRAEKMGVVCLMTSILDRSGRWPSVGYDNRRGGQMLADHVLRLGHRQIAVMVGETTGNDRAALRREGIVETLCAAGVTPCVVLERPVTLAGGRDGMQAILAQAPDVSAVICGSDAQATGVLFEAQARGLSVPGDLSVTGFDGSVLARCTTPALTTVRAPVVEMGRAAADEIAALVAGESLREYPVELPVALVEAGSTGPFRPRLARSGP